MPTRAAREAASPALLGAAEARQGLPGRAFAVAVVVFGANTLPGTAWRVAVKLAFAYDSRDADTLVVKRQLSA